MSKPKTTRLLLIALFTVTFFTLISCEKDDDSTSSSGNYVVALRTQGTSGTSDYLLVQNSISHESVSISATGKGVEQLGWCYYTSVGKTVFSFSYGQNNKGIAYVLSPSGQLIERGSFSFERLDCMGKGDDNTVVGIGAPWGGGSYDCEIMLIDANNVGISKRTKTRIYSMSANDTLNKWPTSIMVRDGKLYVSFYPLHGVTWKTPLTDTAYVAVFTYPGLQPVTILKDTRTSPIGYYGSQPALIKADNGDIYTISSSSIAAGYTQATKHSGILRIKDGEDQFDSNYFFDVEAATGGAKLLTGTYVGNNKMVARMVLPNADTAVWSAFDVSIPICKLVVIDLVNKTVTDVSGVPIHGGEYNTSALVENGKAYMSVTTTSANEARLYEIDPSTATGKKAARIEGIEVPAIFKLE